MNILIRHAVADDCPALNDLYARPLAMAGTLQTPLQTPEVWKSRLAGASLQDRHLVAVVNDTLVGNLGLSRMTNARRAHVASLGMAVRDDFQGKGVGAALMKAALDLADNWLGILRLELTVYADNEAALALYQRHGFVQEGLHRAYSLRGGQYVDALAMARLHPAPPALLA